MDHPAKPPLREFVQQSEGTRRPVAANSAKTLSERFALAQTNKGTYTWDAKQKRTLVTLSDNADISTILHETARHQLRYMPSGMYKVLANGAGVNPDTELEKLSVADFVDLQEYWARGVATQPSWKNRHLRMEVEYPFQKPLHTYTWWKRWRLLSPSFP
jgi:hypothetical protein